MAVAADKKLVTVLINGGTIDLTWVKQNSDAILEAWYPGQAGGEAVAAQEVQLTPKLSGRPAQHPQRPGQSSVLVQRYEPLHSAAHLMTILAAVRSKKRTSKCELGE